MRIGLLVLGMLFLTGCATSLESGEEPYIHSSGEPAAICIFPNNISDRIFFDLDSSVLGVESQDVLESQAALLKKSYPDSKLTIEGHADERGTREYNLALGERRANAVKNYLVALGFDASRISTISYGKERPYEIGDTEEAWTKNRRAVTTID